MSIWGSILVAPPHTVVSESTSTQWCSFLTHGVCSKLAKNKHLGVGFSRLGGTQPDVLRGAMKWKHSQTSGLRIEFQSDSSACTTLQSRHLPNAYVSLNLKLDKDFNSHSRYQ